MALSGFAIKRLQKDLGRLERDFDTCFYQVKDEGIGNITFIIIHKNYTMGEHKFRNYYIILNMKFPENYPFDAPVVKNIEHNGCMMKGNICLSTFSHYHSLDTNPTWDFVSLFTALLSMQNNDEISGIGWVRNPKLNDIIRSQKNIQRKIDDGDYDEIFGDGFMAYRLSDD